MPDAQISLDGLFDRIRSDKSSTFAAGASLSAIQQVQEDLKILFPGSLVKFWQEFNGGEFGFGRICSIESVGAEMEEVHSYNRALKKLGWVPFGDTYGGDLLCFEKPVNQADTIKCAVIEWDHEADFSDCDDGEEEDDDDVVVDELHDREVAEEPYLSRYPDLRDLIADYYEKNAQLLLEPSEPDTQVEAWKAKVPQEVKGLHKVKAPQEMTGLHEVKAPQEMTGLHEVKAPQEMKGLHEVKAPQEVTGLHEVKAPQEVTGAATDKPVAETKTAAETKIEKPALAHFLCPHCSNSSFQLLLKLELSPGDDLDEEQVQLYKCEKCGLHGIGWYEESKRGSLDGEVSQHRGFSVGSLYWKSLAHWFTGCPEPENKQCSCYSHKWLKEQGRFAELSEHAAWFDLKH